MIRMTDPSLGKLSVNGIPLPGRVRIDGASKMYRWEVIQGHRLAGAKVRPMGADLCKFTAFVDVWTQEHFVQWDLVREMLEPGTYHPPFTPRAGTPTSYALHLSGNAILADLKITEAVVEELGQLQPSGAVWTIPIKFLQYVPFVPVNASGVRGSIPAGGGGVVPAKTEADFAVQKAQAEFERAKAGG